MDVEKILKYFQSIRHTKLTNDPYYKKKNFISLKIKNRESEATSNETSSVILPIWDRWSHDLCLPLSPMSRAHPGQPHTHRRYSKADRYEQPVFVIGSTGFHNLTFSLY